MLRGTIAEHVPNSHVSIVLPTGEVRRVEAGEVQWAGPAAEMPPARMGSVTTQPSYGAEYAPPPQPPLTPGIYAPPGVVVAAPGMPVATSTVPVRFEADREGVRVDVRVGTSEHIQYSTGRYGISSRLVHRPIFQQLCLTPCTQEMTAGRFQIGVSLGDGARTYLIQEAIDARAPTRVQIHWGDRYAIRVIGSIVWALVGGLGTAGVIVGSLMELNSYSSWSNPGMELLVAGATAVGVSTVVGLSMALLKDEISFQVGPM
jgi:hypothetical protein